ncbi:MAG: DUF1566 domain-containing protein [Polaromonas sp.]|uniref:Lcl C-terminal domain-containing protein n=1 Tax=Polaromonas sp. TaxID=1869339 RepID=UPI00248A1990|nr:DUF1566 domain-containing protein [Polaromonas sp.]MDI1237487.1 DUF1566 domain-containing protein [Polaromonas sp.]
MNLSPYLLAVALALPLTGIAQSRFEVSADGHQVLDRQTNLVWKRCAEGQGWNGSACVGSASKLTFDEALVATANSSGWRLPAIKELFSIARTDETGLVPEANRPSENTGLVFWASTPRAATPQFTAWGVDLGWATTLPDLRTATNHVRMVRFAPSLTNSAKSPNDRGVSFKTIAGPDGQPYARTECVLDAVTGLTWEGKPSDGSFRDKANRYTNFDNQDKTQVMVSNVPSRPSPDQLTAATNALTYVKAVNAAKLCGYSDWRLPSMAELHDLVNFGNAAPPMLDSAWFPNTPTPFFYWTSEAHPANPTSARVLNLALGAARATSRATPGYVRLVR